MDGQSENQGRFPDVPLTTPWTAERRELHGWFHENAPSLAGAYEGAVRLLGVPAFPGRIHLISHVVRDICNRLPDFLGSVERSRLQYDRELDALSEIWPRSFRPSASDYDGTNTKIPEDADVRIPRIAAVAVDRLLEKHGSRQTNRGIASDLFAIVAGASEFERANLEPIVAEFHNTEQWFMERSHVRKEPMQIPEQAEIARRFEQFERITLSLVRPFFRTMEDLNALLPQANATTD